MSLYLNELPPSYTYKMTLCQNVLSLTLIKNSCQEVGSIPAETMSQKNINQLADKAWEDYFPQIVKN